MTSEFYDLPGVYWIFKHVFQAIRVQWSVYRRHAPEIQEAVQVLDRGGGVVLFPEGRLHRHPELLLRKFGQGVWRSLPRAAGDAGGRLLGRGRLRQLHVVFQGQTDAEQAARLLAPHRRGRGSARAGAAGGARRPAVDAQSF